MYLKPVLEYTCWIFTLIEALGHKLEVFLFFIYLFIYFWWGKFFRKRIKLYFYIMYQSISSVEHFFFSFPLNFFFISTRFLFLLIYLSLAQCWIFCYLYCFEVFVFVPFRTLLMLVSMNKAKFSLEKKFIAF